MNNLLKIYIVKAVKVTASGDVVKGYVAKLKETNEEKLGYTYVFVSDLCKECFYNDVRNAFRALDGACERYETTEKNWWFSSVKMESFDIEVK